MPVGLLPMTELEAINEILATGSDSPVSTLEDNSVIDAALAKQTLRNTSWEVQTRGWFFNTEYDLEIVPDEDGFINLPLNTYRVDTTGASAALDCIQRGKRLYNRTDKTYVFDAPVTVEIVLGLDYEDLPSSARAYITIRAARKYQDRYFGDDQMHSYNKDDELWAHASLMEEDLASSDANMLQNSQFMQDLRRRS